jgi:hypothetical protein
MKNYIADQIAIIMEDKRSIQVLPFIVEGFAHENDFIFQIRDSIHLS